MTIPCSKSSRVDVFFFNSYLMITWPNINLEENFCIFQLIKQVIDPWKKILILHNYLVQLFKIDVQSQCPIFLLHKQDWGTPRWHTWAYIPLLQNLFNLHLQFLQLWCTNSVGSLWHWVYSKHQIYREINIFFQW